MNSAWHEKNPMPRNATDAQRLRWHRAHQNACACRPIPASLLACKDGSGAVAKSGKAASANKKAKTASPARRRSRRQR